MAFRKRQNAKLKENKPQVTGRHCHHHTTGTATATATTSTTATISTSTSSALPAAGARPLRPRAAHRLPVRG